MAEKKGGLSQLSLDQNAPSQQPQRPSRPSPSKSSGMSLGRMRRQTPTTASSYVLSPHKVGKSLTMVVDIDNCVQPIPYLF